MKIVIDIETDALVNPKHIWCIVCKDIDTGVYSIFRNVTKDKNEHENFIRYIERLRSEADSQLIGHNLLGFDYPVLHSTVLLHSEIHHSQCLDTLILSKLIDYSRKGHSIEDYGIEFGLEKGKFTDFSKYSKEMEDYCVRDVDICHRIYSKYLRYITNPLHHNSIALEHQFQLVVNGLHDSGFGFNSNKAKSLLEKVEKELGVLDKDILEAFPPKLKLIREITPKETKYGTLNRTDFRWLGSEADLTDFNGGPFCRCSWEPFNPSSHKQIISVLSAAGWSPVDKTQSHIDTERELNRLKYTKGVDIRKKETILSLEQLKKTGWKVNENNLESLPEFEPLLLWKNKCRIKVNSVEKDTLRNIINDTRLKSEQKPSSITIKIDESTREISSNVVTAFLLRTLNNYATGKNTVAEFVSKSNHLWSIIVTPTDIFVDCSAACATVTWVGMKDLPNLQQTISQLQAARLLAKRILLESRRRTLTEWLGLVQPDNRIHGKFYAIGAWTHRMAHQNPNTANIPNEFDTAGKKKLLGKELRSLWCAGKNRLLVGVDAEGIQLRIFAHLINDPEFTDALVKGKKDDKTDPHSLNQSIIGSHCKSRQAAKRFIYALLLGAGLGKLAEILGCSESEARDALDRLMGRYTGWAHLKAEVFPKDANRGWFTGLDGRKVRIPGDTHASRKHLAMSGYLQNGEAVVMKSATLKWWSKLEDYDAKLVNFVHDEWQVECPNNMNTALAIAKMMADSLRQVGEDLKLNCPLAGSYYNDDIKDYTIATNWAYTH